MTTPDNPRFPVISSGAELREALAQRFLDNAASGDNSANDQLVTAYTDWCRTHDSDHD